MIRFHDFAPRQLAPPGVFHDGKYDTFESAVSGANAWIREQQIKVINFETVVLPNMWEEDGTQDPEICTHPGHALWYQFVRVWYEARE